MHDDYYDHLAILTVVVTFSMELGIAFHFCNSYLIYKNGTHFCTTYGYEHTAYKKLFVIVTKKFAIRPMLMVHTKNKNENIFVFVFCKIVMHGLTVKQKQKTILLHCI